MGATSAATYLAVAGRALGDAAIAVQRALDEGDVEHARILLPALVGRDPNGLDEKEVARATVESVAENTVDAIVAPALWAVALGSAGVLAYRGVNTMDAMVGHRSERYERYGWASARLDDVAGWVPARVTALLVAAVRPRAAAAVVRVVRRDASAHPSPTPVSPKPLSPARWGSVSAAGTGTATAWRCVLPSETAVRRRPPTLVQR